MSPERLESVNAIRAHQREWLADTRQRAVDGEPFVICNSDELEEILAVFDIPVLVINYWNFVITAQRKAEHFSSVLAERGYVGPHFFGLGLGSTIDPQNAPWGGLPRPTLIVGSTRHESELKVTELWAREFGCPCYPLDFNFASPYRRLPGDDWWARVRDDWAQLVDPARLELRVEENKALINYLEMLTGRSFSFHKLRRVMELVNEQMDYMSRARDLIAAARPCPVSLRDQMSAYQTNWHRGTPRGLELARAYYAEVKQRVEAGQGRTLQNAGECCTGRWTASRTFTPSWSRSSAQSSSVRRMAPCPRRTRARFTTMTRCARCRPRHILLVRHAESELDAARSAPVRRRRGSGSGKSIGVPVSLPPGVRSSRTALCGGAASDRRRRDQGAADHVREATSQITPSLFRVAIRSAE